LTPSLDAEMTCDVGQGPLRAKIMVVLVSSPPKPVLVRGDYQT
jgi:hypothetical protein